VSFKNSPLDQQQLFHYCFILLDFYVAVNLVFYFYLQLLHFLYAFIPILLFLFVLCLGGAKPLKWLSGYCTKLGPRNSNEDRLVCAPDLNFSMLELSGQHADVNALIGDQATATIGGGATDSCAYFAVYDGHCGAQASTYLQNFLMQSIYKYKLL